MVPATASIRAPCSCWHWRSVWSAASMASAAALSVAPLCVDPVPIAGARGRRGGRGRHAAHLDCRRGAVRARPGTRRRGDATRLVAGAAVRVGGLVGMYTGARLQKFVPQRVLHAGLAAVMLVTAGFYVS
ncbi:MAG: hypothetical protein MZV65_29290 [Chromatiales bacterium]|nr:hypothetical protein [Chromatiales bacterium]